MLIAAFNNIFPMQGCFPSTTQFSLHALWMRGLSCSRNPEGYPLPTVLFTYALCLCESLRHKSSLFSIPPSMAGEICSSNFGSTASKEASIISQSLVLQFLNFSGQVSPSNPEHPSTSNKIRKSKYHLVITLLPPVLLQLTKTEIIKSICYLK